MRNCCCRILDNLSLLFNLFSSFFCRIEDDVENTYNSIQTIKKNKMRRIKIIRDFLVIGIWNIKIYMSLGQSRQAEQNYGCTNIIFVFLFLLRHNIIIFTFCWILFGNYFCFIFYMHMLALQVYLIRYI